MKSLIIGHQTGFSCIGLLLFVIHVYFHYNNNCQFLLTDVATACSLVNERFCHNIVNLKVAKCKINMAEPKNHLTKKCNIDIIISSFMWHNRTNTTIHWYTVRVAYSML